MKKLFAVMLLVCATLTVCGNEDASTPESTEAVESTVVESIEIETESAEESTEESTEDVTNSTVIDDTETETIPEETIPEEPKTDSEWIEAIITEATTIDPVAMEYSAETLLIARDNADSSKIVGIAFRSGLDSNEHVYYFLSIAPSVVRSNSKSVEEFLAEKDTIGMAEYCNYTWEEYNEKSVN